MLYRTLLLALILFSFNSKSNADNCIPNPNGATYYANSSANSGPGSIRQAILDANAAQVGGTIIISGGSPINLFSALPSITVDSLQIRGNFVDFNHSVTEPVFTFTTQHSCVSVDAGLTNVNPGTFTVTNTNDTGVGSLRDAISKSNCSFSNDNIFFNIPGTAPHVIPLVNALPLISNPITIMGSSQPANGYTGNSPKIMLDGSFAPAPVNGLTVYSNPFYSPIRTINISGLSIQNCVVGIEMSYTTGYIGNSSSKNVISDCGTGLSILKSTGITIRNNYFGVDSSGTIAHPNNVAISLGYDTNTTVIDNLISGNVHGLTAGTGKDITITGNKIGTDASGMFAIPNTINGIELASNSGISQINGNLISGNRNSSGNCRGLDIHFNNTVQINGNKIGTNITGNDTIGNDDGIYIAATSFTASNNLISGNNHGIYTFQFSATISNNKIGTNLAGTAALPNNYGIWMSLQQQDTAIITDNLVSGNVYGIEGNFSNGYCVIKRNYIGLDNLHVNSIPNGYGIGVSNGSQGRLIIGGINPSDGNYVSGNTFNGIGVGCACLPTSTIIRNNKIGITPSGGVMGNHTGIYIHDNNIQVQDNFVKNNIEGITIGIQSAMSEIWTNTIQDNHTGILVYGNQSYIHHNIISNNLQDGIYVLQGGRTTISRNQIFDNGMKGINLDTNYNVTNLISPPITIHADSSLIYGTSKPNSRIELFYSQSQNQNPQGKTLIDSVNADTSGNWTYTGALSSPCNVTVTQTDSAGTTSEFSLNEVPAYAGIDSTICMNTSLTLYALPLQTGQTGQWSSPNGLSFGNITNPHSTASGFTTQTTYTLIWSVSNGACMNSDTVMILVDPCLGINAAESDLIKVYPNPATDKIYVETNEDMSGSTFEMWQLDGKVVLSTYLKNHLSVIDVSKFSKGMYVYRIVNNKGVFLQRILLN